jgi:hypothetical protein
MAINLPNFGTAPVDPTITVSVNRLSPEAVSLTCTIEFPEGSHQAADSPFFGISAQAGGLDLILEAVRLPEPAADSGWWSNQAVFEYRAALPLAADGTELALDVTVGWQLCLDDATCLAPGWLTLPGLPIAGLAQTAAQAVAAGSGPADRPGALATGLAAGLLVLVLILVSLTRRRKTRRQQAARPDRPSQTE